MSSGHRQLAQRQPQQILDRPVVDIVGQQPKGVTNLVGAVAQSGERGPHVGCGDRPRWPPARALIELGLEIEIEPGLELEQQTGCRLLADAGHGAQRVDVVAGDRSAQR